jgi:hypothetical protein
MKLERRADPASYSLLGQARDYLTRAQECFERAAVTDDLANLLILTRLGQAFYDAADEVRQQIEDSMPSAGLHARQTHH